MRVDPRRLREKMVAEQLEGRGVADEAVLAAMRAVPRHMFVEEALAQRAYADRPLPIGHGQTISQPYIVARMSELLQVEPGASVLEIGTGSGYQAAVLAEMGAEVCTVERIRALYLAARELMIKLRCFRVRLKLDDGTVGWPEEAPFDRIMVTAGGPRVPEPLVDQLGDPGRMVVPVGSAPRTQELKLVVKEKGQVRVESKGAVAFVDLVGSHGW